MAISNLSNGLRTGVCTFANRPTTPYEGQVIYETDTDLSYIWGGTAWQQVSGGTAVGNSGLVLVKSQTIGNSVTSVEVTSAFSATYDNYLIQVNGGSSTSNSSDLRLQMGSTVSSYRYQLIYGAWAGTPLAEGSSTAVNFVYTGSMTTTGAAMNCFVFNPFLATQTRVWANYNAGYTSDVGTVSGLLNNSTQYTSFTLVINTGTLTGGTIRVYGYRQ